MTTLFQHYVDCYTIVETNFYYSYDGQLYLSTLMVKAVVYLG